MAKARSQESQAWAPALPMQVFKLFKSWGSQTCSWGPRAWEGAGERQEPASTWVLGLSSTGQGAGSGGVGLGEKISKCCKRGINFSLTPTVSPTLKFPENSKDKDLRFLRLLPGCLVACVTKPRLDPMEHNCFWVRLLSPLSYR